MNKLPDGWEYRDGLVVNTQPNESMDVYSPGWLRNHAWGEATTNECIYIINKIKKLHGIKTVLDAGCSSGKLVHLLGKGGYSAIGIDKLPESIIFAEKEFKGHFICDDILRDGISYLSADIVVLAHTLEHFGHPVEMLEALKKYMKTDSQLLITVPNLWAYEPDGWRGIATANIFASQHKLAFTPPSLVDIVGKAGYHITSVSTHTYPYQFLAGVYRTMVNKITKETVVRPQNTSVVQRQLLYALPEWVTWLPDRISERHWRGAELMIIARRNDR